MRDPEEAGKGQVGGGCCSAVLPGDDVIDLERNPAKILVQLAVFAAVLGAPPDELGYFFVHEIRRRRGAS